jgi:hypothetical protein
MQAQRIGRKLSEDERMQRAILALVLAVHPHHRTMAEVSREIGNKEAVERAARRLSDYGLVRLHGHPAPDRSRLPLPPPRRMVSVAERFGENLMIYQRRTGSPRKSLVSGLSPSD